MDTPGSYDDLDLAGSMALAPLTGSLNAAGPSDGGAPPPYSSHSMGQMSMGHNASAHSASDAAAPVSTGAPRAPTADAGVCSMSYFQSFFDISSEEAGRRIMRALVPIGPPFYPSAAEVAAALAADAATADAAEAAADAAAAGQKQPAAWAFGLAHSVVPEPDLYCPFWIVTTLIFVLAITGNLVDYLNSNANDMVWSYDFEKISLAATVFYLSLIIFPVGVYLALRKLSAGRPLVNIISLYGYSFAIYIPICPICAIPLPYLNLLGVFIAWLVSAFFLTRNIYSYFLAAPVPQGNDDEAESHKSAGLLLVLAVAAVHFGIACIAYFYFFHW